MQYVYNTWKVAFYELAFFRAAQLCTYQFQIIWSVLNPIYLHRSALRRQSCELHNVREKYCNLCKLFRMNSATSF